MVTAVLSVPTALPVRSLRSTSTADATPVQSRINAALHFFTEFFRIVDCRALLKQYEESDNPDIADHLIESLSAARRHCWEELKSDELHTLKQEELSTDMSAWCCSTTIQVNTPVSQRQCHCCTSHPGC